MIGTVSVSASVLPFLAEALGQKATGNFLLTTNPSALSVVQGTSATTTVTLVSVNGFKGTVALYTDTTGGYFSAAFANRTATLTVNGISTTTLKLTAPTKAIGSYRIVVTGTASMSQKRMVSSSAQLSVQVMSNADFQVQADPSSVTVGQAQNVSTTIIVTSLNGFVGNVSLSAATPFGFIGIMGGSDPIILTAGGTANTTLKISTTPTTAFGTYNLTVTGTSSQRSHSIQVMMIVTDPVVEQLVLVKASLSSSTDLALSLKNTGSTSVTSTRYSVTDSLGDVWSLAGWTGPIITPGGTSQASILIGTSCGACVYTGYLFGFQQFSHGQTYDVMVTTAQNNVFKFTVTV